MDNLKPCPFCGNEKLKIDQKTSSNTRMKRDAFQVRECPVCKKQFVPVAFHAYKVHIRNYTKKVCSYHCMREYQKGKRK